jgi:hypothetical protein
MTSTSITQDQKSESRLPMSNEDNLTTEVFLWRAVLGQAVRDIYSGKDTDRSEVARWLKSDDFHTCCSLADVHPDELRNQMINLLALPRMLAKKYGMILRSYLVSDSD